MTTTSRHKMQPRLQPSPRKGKTVRDRREGDSPAAEDATSADRVPWYRSTLAMGLYGGALLYLSFPPLAHAPRWLVEQVGLAEFGAATTVARLLPCLLAWVATVPWLLLVRMEKLPGSRPYRALYVAGFLHWLILVQWVRLGHWAAHFGWVALALYLAVYLPAFIWLARTAVHRLRVPLLLAAPVMCVGLECLRGWLMTGFSIALLGHTQVAWPGMIQVSDLGGAYAVSFVVMFVAAAVATVIPGRWYDRQERPASAGTESSRTAVLRFWPLATAAALLVLVFGYGYFRLQQVPPGASTDRQRFALVQGSIDTDFDDPTVDERTHDQYLALTRQAIVHRPQAILWPESTLIFPAIEMEDQRAAQAPRWFDGSNEEFARRMQKQRDAFHQGMFNLGLLPDDEHVPLILGGMTLRLGPHAPQRFNSAIFVNKLGIIEDAYHKMHPVAFGEYAPGGKLFPWIYDLMPFDEGLTPGERPHVFEVAGLRLAPSICYENTVPHLIRRQVAELTAAGNKPDVLVTLSNDGWFYGSAQLDMHLACGQFRAVELRKPAMIAANTGFSAYINGNGQIIQQGPRRQTAVLLVDVQPDGRHSVYSLWGDWFANACLIANGAVAVLAVAFRRKRSKWE